MKRDSQSLTEKEFDILVLGGGIYGATVAWEAAGRGLSVALIERSDFGSRTTANSLKTVHGGLRYLQHLDLPRVRQCIRERTILMRIAPHLVHPLPCLMPTYGHGMKGREVMFVGLLLNDIVSCDRNWLDDPEKRIPNGRVLSRRVTLGAAPGIDGQRVTGGASWTDAQMADSERVVLAFIQTAARAGACVANYTEARSLVRRGNRIEGVEAVDRLGGQSIKIRARLVVNATGGWMDDLLRTAEIEAPKIQLSTAMNLVVNRALLPGPSLGITSHFTFKTSDHKERQCSRVLFMAPWNGATLIGTYHQPFPGKPDEMTVTEKEISTFLTEINEAYPGGAIQRNEVSWFHKGFLPMDGVDPNNGEVILSKHSKLIDHKKEDGVEGLVGLAGVKYTTARDEARRTVDLAARKLKTRVSQSHSHRTPLVGGDIGQFDSFFQLTVNDFGSDLTEETIRRLVVLYGSEVEKVLKLSEKDAPKQKLLKGTVNTLRAEILHAIREEMAVKLTDIVLRRTDLGTVSCPDDKTLEAAVTVMAGELGWSAREKQREIESVKSEYRPGTRKGRTA